MRVRTLLTLTTGAAAGAGAMYLLDPEHGADRRRQARRSALRQARSRAVGLAGDSRRHVAELAGAAVAGYRQTREEAGGA